MEARPRWPEHVKTEETRPTEDIHGRWYHLGEEEEEEDQIGDGWTVSTET